MKMSVQYKWKKLTTLTAYVFGGAIFLKIASLVRAADINPTQQELEKLNRTLFGQGADPHFTTPNYELFKTPRGILSVILPYLFTFAGLILFIMLLWGGFEMLTGAANPKAQEAGKARMTAAIIGFLLIFASYWLAQILQIVFGISILK